MGLDASSPMTALLYRSILICSTGTGSLYVWELRGEQRRAR
jgi:hypothetical protein